jgi:hypothetical protein
MTSNLCRELDCHNFADAYSGPLGLCTACHRAYLMQRVMDLEALLAAKPIVIVPREEL